MSKSPKPGKFRQDDSRKLMAGASNKEIVGFVTDNLESYEVLDCSHNAAAGVTLSSDQHQGIAEGLKTNTHIHTVNLTKMGIDSKAAIAYAEALKVNTTITNLDIGYNKIGGQGMIALGEAFTTNSNLIEIRIHRQEVEMGAAAEIALVKLWDTNITLTRLYATLHDRRCNSTNTKGEVRNKSIAKCIKEGKSYLHLDPNRADEYRAQEKKRREDEAAAKKLANAPISEKIASTGGPYTYKQLTCKIAFLPDDIEKGKKETYLTDEEFEKVFKMTREDFDKLAGWKKKNIKKSKKLH